MKVERTNQDATFKFKITVLERSMIFNKKESIKLDEKLESLHDQVNKEQVAMKKEFKFTISIMESLHGKVNQMLVKKAEQMNERIS